MFSRLISFYGSKPALISKHQLKIKPILTQQRFWLSSNTFESVSDETLESLCEHIEELIDKNPKLAEADVCLANGVLTLSLPKPYGTYVINKQSPNKQIWLSSPKSGPMRYDLQDESWIYKHTNESLHSLLEREIGQDLLKMSDAGFMNCYFAK